MIRIFFSAMMLVLAFFTAEPKMHVQGSNSCSLSVSIGTETDSVRMAPEPPAGLGLGYGLSVEQDTDGGIYVTSSVGLQCSLSRSLRFSLSVGYGQRKPEPPKAYGHELFTAEFTGRIDRHLVMLRIGIEY